ncbi:hypothetical protein LTR85_008676 [Meristemomyces frigidus]|nr:hypothetical protein LTR85_008676 [Meristemomyces frigidus]
MTEVYGGENIVPLPYNIVRAIVWKKRQIALLRCPEHDYLGLLGGVNDVRGRSSKEAAEQYAEQQVGRQIHMLNLEKPADWYTQTWDAEKLHQTTDLWVGHAHGVDSGDNTQVEWLDPATALASFQLSSEELADGNSSELPCNSCGAHKARDASYIHRHANMDVLRSLMAEYGADLKGKGDKLPEWCIAAMNFQKGQRYTGDGMEAKRKNYDDEQQGDEDGIAAVEDGEGEGQTESARVPVSAGPGKARKCRTKTARKKDNAAAEEVLEGPQVIEGKSRYGRKTTRVLTGDWNKRRT